MLHSGRCVGVALVAAALAGWARADEPKDARAVIEKAVRASGGAKAVAKTRARTWTSKGTYYGMGGEVPFTATHAMELPDKFRFEVQGFMTMVVNGNKGWVQMNGETQQMNKDQLANAREGMYVGRVAELVPLLKDKGFKLTLLGESKVGKTAAIGVKVAHAGHKDVKLYFDKESGLLLKAEARVKAEEAGGKEVKQEEELSDYKEVDGVKMPTKTVIRRDGERYVEAENSDYKFPKSLPEKNFEKP